MAFDCEFIAGDFNMHDGDREEASLGAGWQDAWLTICGPPDSPEASEASLTVDTGKRGGARVWAIVFDKNFFPSSSVVLATPAERNAFAKADKGDQIMRTRFDRLCYRGTRAWAWCVCVCVEGGTGR